MNLCYLRGKGTASEDQIAQKLDFADEDGAPLTEAMYERLEAWGLPGWVVRPRGEEKRTRDVGRRGGEGKKVRKARATGDVEELPPAGRAVALFRQDLERLTYYLRELRGLKEQLQAERFVSSSWVGEDWDVYYKTDFSQKQWEELCERHGEDPSTEAIRVPIYPINPLGASPTPWEGLVTLIAVHAIMYETVDNLIEALHPDPSSVDVAELYRKRGVVDTLRTSAENLAKTVRGGKVREGHHPGEISYVDQWVAWFLITPLAKNGYSDKQIHALICKKSDSLGEEYTVDDVARLRKLHLPPPDRAHPENFS